VNTTHDLPGPVHKDRPEIDGFCFSELFGFPDEVQRAMARTGKVYVTEFLAITPEGRGSLFTGNLIANNLREAIAEAKRRKLGERVVGRLMGVGTVNGRRGP
jgi:hypothetical protein